MARIRAMRGSHAARAPAEESARDSRDSFAGARGSQTHAPLPETQEDMARVFPVSLAFAVTREFEGAV
jgi:hypothetical protein